MKGIPVAGTGKRRWHTKGNRAGKPNGVMGNSRIVPNRYADEGENGKFHRREIRSKEKQFFRRVILAEF